MRGIDLGWEAVLAAALVGAMFAAGGVLAGRGVTNASYTDTAVSGVISVSVTSGQSQVQMASESLPAQLVAAPAASPVPVVSTAPQQNPAVTRRRAMVKLNPHPTVDPNPPDSPTTTSSAPTSTSASTPAPPNSTAQ